MRVIACIPYYGGLKVEFVGSLLRLTVHTIRECPEISLKHRFLTGSMLPMQRNKLAIDAMADGADYLLWMDTDHSFPRDALDRLLAADKPIVGANYRRRNAEAVAGVGVTLREDGSMLHIASSQALASGPLQEVHALGFGLCLIRRDVFEAVPQPWFQLELDATGTKGLTEDWYFCRNARLAGFSTWIDHALSMEVGHVAETELRFPR